MTEHLIGYLEGAALLAPTWGFLLVFVFMTVESSFVPFPSEVVMLPAGFIAARGGLGTGNPVFDLVVSILLGILGSLAGAWINYGLSLKLGQPFLERYGRYFFLPPHHLHRAEEIFRRYGAGATFFCRLLPAIRQLISIPAGLSRMRPGTFTLWTGLGAGIWVVFLTSLGFAAGQHTANMSWAELVHAGKDTVHHHMVWIAPACIAGIAIYVWVSRKIMGAPAAAER